MKKTLQKLIFAAACLFGSGIAANAQSFTVGDLTYRVLDKEKMTVAVKAAKENLERVTIPRTVVNNDSTFIVTETEEFAFDKQGSLQYIFLPKTIVKCGKNSFNLCSNLKITDIEDFDAFVQIDFPNSLANPVYKSENLYLNGKVLVEAVINVPIKEIRQLTFYFCRTLKKLTLPETVTKIGKWGFYRCGFEYVNLPEKITTFDTYAFQYCGLKEVDLPDSLKTMPTSMFTECLNLERVKLPLNMVTLPSNTFKSCHSLKEVIFSENLKTISTGAFVATSLTKLVLPKNLVKISNSAFYDDKYLKEVEIGPNVTSVGVHAFYIPEASGKSLIEKVTCLAVTPPDMPTTAATDGTMVNEAFNDEVYENVTLMVPAASVEAYKAANEWKRFKKIEGIGQSGIEDVTADKEADEVIYYNLNGMRVVNPGTGIYIRKHGSRTSKVVIP